MTCRPATVAKARRGRPAATTELVARLAEGLKVVFRSPGSSPVSRRSGRCSRCPTYLAAAAGCCSTCRSCVVPWRTREPPGPSVDGSLTTLGVVAAGVHRAVRGGVAAGRPHHDRAPSAPARPSRRHPDGGRAGAPTTTTTGKNATGPRNVGQGHRRRQPGRPGPNVAPEVAGGTCNSSNNGGKTDRGVSATSIKLGATVVSSGIGASFLGPVRVGIDAVKNEVNRAGGICGRQLTLKLVDDGWDAQRGCQLHPNLVEGDKVFALAVNPSSEGVRIASDE